MRPNPTSEQDAQVVDLANGAQMATPDDISGPLPKLRSRVRTPSSAPKKTPLQAGFSLSAAVPHHARSS